MKINGLYYVLTQKYVKIFACCLVAPCRYVKHLQGIYNGEFARCPEQLDKCLRRRPCRHRILTRYQQAIEFHVGGKGYCRRMEVRSKFFECRFQLIGNVFEAAHQLFLSVRKRSDPLTT